LERFGDETFKEEMYSYDLKKINKKYEFNGCKHCYLGNTSYLKNIPN